MRIRYFCFLLVALTLCPGGLLAVEEEEALAFFNRGVELSDSFDAAVAELYADTAKITSIRRYPSGKVQTMSLTGKQWKEFIPKVLPMAEKQGDRSKYRDIAVTLIDGGARIKANRYSVMDDYTDTGYYMVIAKGEDGKLLIVEEYTETQADTDDEPLAKRGSDINLADLFTEVAEEMRALLPLMVDDDTRWDGVELEMGALQYQYTLVNYGIGDLNVEAFNQAMSPILKRQSCGNPKLRQLVDLGGTVSYLYRDRDGSIVATFETVSADCE